MPDDRILVVCTANICRSPLAELLLATWLRRAVPGAAVEVASAGTRARPGHAAADGMQAVASSWGLDLGGHRSQRLDRDLATAQTLVLTMEDRHRSAVGHLAAGLVSRTFLLTELAAIAESGVRTEGDAPPRAGLAGHVAAWHATRARLAADPRDVEDPYGGTPEDYRRTAWELAALVERVGPLVAAAIGDGRQ